MPRHQRTNQQPNAYRSREIIQDRWARRAEGCGAPRAVVFTGVADKLMNIYGTWFANEQFIADAWSRIPCLRCLALMR